MVGAGDEPDGVRGQQADEADDPGGRYRPADTAGPSLRA